MIALVLLLLIVYTTVEAWISVSHHFHLTHGPLLAVIWLWLITLAFAAGSSD